MYTVKDISKMTGVSKSVISRYFNGNNVHKKNKALIEEVVKKTGYIPNETARSLRAHKTKIIGAIVPSFGDSFAMTVIQHVKSFLKEQGYSLFVTDCLSDKEGELTCVKMMLQKRVDALIMLPVNASDETCELMRKNNVPLIFFDQYYPNEYVDSVLFENAKGAYRATEIFIENGHKNIAAILGPLSDYTPSERFNGFRACMCDNGLEIKGEYIKVNPDYSVHSGYLRTKELFELPTPPSAVLSSNYDITLGMLKALNELELNIAKDISVIAFDSLHIHEILRPSLCTVVQPLHKIGEKIAEVVFKRVKGETPESRINFIRYEIFQGGSILKMN